jgi:hypothetical protein
LFPPLIALLPALLGAQSAVKVTNPAAPVLDTRPFGKYLVLVCTVPDGGSVVCPAAPAPDPLVPFPPPPVSYPVAAPPELTPQTITLKQVGCLPGAVPCPQPVYPIPKGATFFIKASSDSGLPVTQEVISGDVTQKSGTDIQQYVANDLGTIVIRATQKGDAVKHYAAATPVEFILKVADPADKSPSCPLLPAAAATQISNHVDLPGIINLLGTPAPFVLAAQGTDTILIYSTRYPLRQDEKEILHTIPAGIAQLAGRTPTSLAVPPAAKPFKVEVEIPHAAALGDLATRINGLNYSGFTVQDIGGDKVRISAPSEPACDSWTAFLSSIRHMQWQVTPEPFEMKLYYLSSTDAVTAFSSLSSSGSGASPSASPTAASGTAPATGAQGSSNTTAGAATIAVNQPPGSAIDIRSDTTPCVIAGLATGNSGACGAGSGSGSGAAPGSTPAASGGSAAAAPKPPGMAAMAVVAGTTEQNPSDLLVFSDTNPGDDAQIKERKRILAQLDLPRPEMLINAWVMQDSTANPRAMGAFSNTVKELVAGYNSAIEDIVRRGWRYVKERTEHPDYFNPDFYSYISDRYVADAEPQPSGTAPATQIDPQKAAQSYLETSGVQMADSAVDRTQGFGICPRGRYCLGYNNLFQPLKPRLTDFLLTLIAAADPPKVTQDAIDEVQGREQPVKNERQCEALRPALGGPRDSSDHCRAIWTSLRLDGQLLPDGPSCAAQDYADILGSMVFNDAPTADPPRPRPHVFLACFRKAANTYLPAAGLLRTAIADFLFNYKMSQQYPHEFGPYDLSQSADALNTALSPLIDAFNQDIIAFQTFMRADVEYQVNRLNRDTDQRCCIKRIFGADKPSFFNDGIVSVRTISGQPTTVNTTSQSTLNASTAPTLSALLNSIATPGGSGTSPLAAVLGTAQANPALLAGVLNAYQTTNVQIGRMLSLSVQPRSLSTASSAEIAVTLNADETSGGPTFSGGGLSAGQDMSRVANHDVNTRIRVESVKLFQVSSFSAVVQRARSRFPLLPPFVEIPYIGTIAGIPLPGAKEYHSSTAVISAMVVPTAADIAYGLRFIFDQVLDGDAGTCSYLKGSAGAGVANACQFRRAVALRDLNQSPIAMFHKFLMTCFATDMKSPYLSSGSLPAAPNPGACKNLSFDRVPRDAF